MLRYALIIEDNGDNNVIQIGKTVTFVDMLLIIEDNGDNNVIQIGKTVTFV